ncbi:hypothetical protein [Halobacterium hubeiense]|uniref:hypothetical protein n=1 Tax=Halobacterium hubeiense TaxID=1407499 RepID=UPI0012F7E9F1|nr:hypothetical protein [Halobacterium hubeiense]
MHRPGYDDPQPVVTDSPPEAAGDPDPIYLEEVRNREHARTNDTSEDGFTHSDDDFQALVAE